MLKPLRQIQDMGAYEDHCFFENVCGKKKTLEEPSVEDETWGNIPEEVGDLSVPRVQFDTQSHKHHINQFNSWSFLLTSDNPEKPRKCHITDNPRYSRTYSSITTAVIAFNKVRVVGFLLIMERVVEKLSVASIVLECS